MRVHPAIKAAIMEGAKAGVFRRAARLNPNAAIWGELARERSRIATVLLKGAMQKLGTDGAKS